MEAAAATSTFCYLGAKRTKQNCISLAIVSIHNAAGVYFSDVVAHVSRYVQVFFDGGFREGVTGAAIHVQAAHQNRNDVPVWYDVLRLSCRIDGTDKSNSLCAETLGFLQAMKAVLSLLQHRSFVFSNNNSIVLQDAPNYDGLQ